ncbi:MAG TPA: GtrA family protein [Chitinivibrionales bacterium]|nr:GtrA family protein [Chitinivibrionales bacterium]
MSEPTPVPALPVVRFVKFGIVGGSGVVVNAGLFYLFTTGAAFDHKVASVIAIECAIINNFLWNYFWTWKDRKTESKRSFAYMLMKFNLSSGLIAFVVNFGLLVLLTDLLHVNYHFPISQVSNVFISNLIGIGCGTLANFFLSHYLVFSKSKNSGE